MRTLVIVERKVLTQALYQLRDGLILVQVDVRGLGGTLFRDLVSLCVNAKVTATCAFHNRLRTHKLHLGAAHFCHMKVSFTEQNGTEFGFTKLTEELGVSAARDIKLLCSRLLLECHDLQIVFLDS
jgi:hypothetical protein